MRNDKFISKTLNVYFNPALDLRLQAFNLLAFGGIAAGIAATLSATLTGISLFNAALNLAVSIGAFILVHFARRTKRYKFCFLFTVVIVFYIAFPLMFFTSGGYRGGMPCWFVFAIVFTALMLEGKATAMFIAGETALYVACCLTAYFFPETVTPFPSEFDSLIDIFVGIFAAGFILLTVIRLYIRIYDNRQMRLMELDKLKTEFLENVSHELKTPITVTRNYALDTLKELGQDNLDIQEMAFNQNRIKAESERLERMVSQLLNVTAIEGGRRKLYMEPLSLAALLSRVVEMNFEKLNENNNKLSLEVPDGLSDVTADPDAIEQVLLNLLSNAARHTREGVITVSLTKHSYQTVCVSDNGEGIPPEIREQVFLRYVERESRVTGRSGMGLYICKKLIDAHGGEIGIESEPGNGAAVWFKLPAGRNESLNEYERTQAARAYSGG